MAQENPVRNPFMLMMHPEIVLAAIETSERLSRLNRHLCRPLDRSSAPSPSAPTRNGDVDSDDDEVSVD